MGCAPSILVLAAFLRVARMVSTAASHPPAPTKFPSPVDYRNTRALLPLTTQFWPAPFEYARATCNRPVNTSNSGQKQI